MARLRPRILLVEDDPLAANALARWLRDDYDVEIAHDGDQALDRLRRGVPFAFVLSAIILPRLTGPELHAHTLRERPSLATRFIFMTGSPCGPVIDESVEASGRPVLSKPFTSYDLAAVLELEI